MMDLGEEKQAQKNNQPDADNEDKDLEAKTSKLSGNRKSRKNESAAQNVKNSRSNSGNNRYESSRLRSRSRSRTKKKLTSTKNTWKSANAWLNFMQDFRANLRGFHGLKTASVFRMAAAQWSQMSEAEKKPYIDAANKIKKLKRQENDGKKENAKKSTKRSNVKKSNNSKESNRRKNNNDEETDKSDSEEDSGEEYSMRNFDSDNGSCDTDGSS